MNRFDLEEQIMSLHAIVDHLNDVSYNVLENDMTKDEVADAVHAVAVIAKLKADKIFDVFTQVMKLDSYNKNLYNDLESDPKSAWY